MDVIAANPGWVGGCARIAPTSCDHLDGGAAWRVGEKMVCVCAGVGESDRDTMRRGVGM